MHKNYFLFAKQVAELKPILLGAVVTNIFTHRKDELVIELEQQGKSHLKARISAHLPYFILTKAEKIKNDKYTFFEQVHTAPILDIRIKKFDKLISLDLGKYTLKFCFYGRNPNIFLLDSEGVVIDSFKNSHWESTGEERQFTDLLSIQATELPALIKPCENSVLLTAFLLSVFGVLNKTLSTEILFRSNIKSSATCAELSDSQITDLARSVNDLILELNDNYFYIYGKDNYPVKLSLIRLHHMEQADTNIRYEVFSSLNKAWIIFSERLKTKEEYDKLNAVCSKSINSRIDYLERSLQKAKEFENISERKKEAELRGNLLLALQNQIDPQKSKVIVDNIFSANQEKITIKLNPNKSVIENAQLYFAKYKDIVKHKSMTKIKTDTLVSELRIAELLSEGLRKATSLIELKKLHDKLIRSGLIKPQDSGGVSNVRKAPHFYHLVLDKGWDVYVGKNGENNDQLTFRFANKWDLWFHAQGVSGSHVLLRIKNKNIPAPKYIIEKTAQIAAGYSKAQHSGTVPVLYTEARYVSRIRNAPAGTVKTQNTKTIFVTPLKG